MRKPRSKSAGAGGDGDAPGAKTAPRSRRKPATKPEDAQVIEADKPVALDAESAGALTADDAVVEADEAEIVRERRQWPASKVEMLAISKLTPNENNPRIHTPEQVDKIAVSIQRFGFTVPVLVDEKNRLIAGHGRVMAAEQLGLPSVPAMRAKGWSDDEKRAYTIADNRLTELSSFDESLLKSEIALLQEAGFETDLTGFSESQVESLFKDQDDLAILEMPTDMPLDRFWITVRGPLANQAQALRRLREIMAELEDVEVRIGTVQRDA